MPVRSTRIITSLMPICGSGTSASQSPGSARDLTSAFISILPGTSGTTVVTGAAWVGQSISGRNIINAELPM
jgi:hypothetical protein